MKNSNLSLSFAADRPRPRRDTTPTKEITFEPGKCYTSEEMEKITEKFSDKLAYRKEGGSMNQIEFLNGNTSAVIIAKVTYNPMDESKEGENIISLEESIYDGKTDIKPRCYFTTKEVVEAEKAKCTDFDKVFRCNLAKDDHTLLKLGALVQMEIIQTKIGNSKITFAKIIGREPE